MNLVLIGMKHCGKTTLGGALAGRWGCAFHDVDPMIEETHACEAGERLSVRDILARHGEPHFRRIEGHVVCELYLKLDHPGSSSVVALGGRTALNHIICELLRAIGTTVYLRLPPDEIFARIERAGMPPFLEGDDPRARFLDLYRQREPAYRQLADIVVDLDPAMSVGQALDRLIASIQEHDHARQQLR